MEEEECKLSLSLGMGIYQYADSYHEKHKKSHVEEEEEQQSKRSRNRERDEEDLTRDGARKKLRLTQEQATLLEDTFKESNTLNSFEKQELAEKLNLRPRQVEVWFQNRRARNKLKQTEVDLQLLKKWYEIMNKENVKLKEELQELKRIKKLEGSILHHDQTSKVTTFETKLTLCPSCSRTMAMAGDKTSASEDSSIAC